MKPTATGPRRLAASGVVAVTQAPGPQRAGQITEGEPPMVLTIRPVVVTVHPGGQWHHAVMPHD